MIPAAVSNIQNFLLPQTMAAGDKVELKVSEPGHWNDRMAWRPEEDPAVNFAEMLNGALDKVNNQQVHAEQLNMKMVADPDSVEMHTVLIAGETARMSLTFAKNMADLAVRTYRELTNLR